MPLRKFLQRLVWAALLPLLLAAVLVAAHRLHTQRGLDQQAGERLAANLMQALDVHMDTRLNALEVMARSSGPLPGKQLERLYREGRAFQEIFGSPVVLADAQGRMLFNTREALGAALAPVSATNARAALNHALDAGRRAVGDRVMEPNDGEPLATVAVPIVRPGQDPLVLLSSIETRELQGLFARWELEPGWSLHLRDSIGATLARRPASAGEGNGQVELVEIARTTSRLSPWTLVVESDAATRHAPTVKAAGLLGSALLLATLLATWAARRGSQRLSEAVASLTCPTPSHATQGLASANPILEITQVRQSLERLAAQRDAAQAELREGEAQLRQLVMHFREPVWISVDQRIAFANPAAQRLMGATVEQMRGQTIAAFLEPESVPAVLAQMERVRAGETDVLFSGLRFNTGAPPCPPLLVSGASLGVGAEHVNLTVAHNVEELHRAREALQASNAELMSLLARLHSVEEDERRRIARELHDDLQQRLGVIALEQQRALDRLTVAPAESSQALQRAGLHTAEALDSLRRVVNGLRPQALDELGLASALEVLAREAARDGALQAECEIIGPEGADQALPEDLASGLYRMAQEALTNVRKHAQADFVHLVLDVSHPGEAVLWVSDNGRGIDASARRRPGAFGLLGLQERLRAAGGRLEVEAAKGGGTRLTARVAWTAEADQAGGAQTTTGSGSSRMPKRP